MTTTWIMLWRWNEVMLYDDCPGQRVHVWFVHRNLRERGTTIAPSIFHCLIKKKVFSTEDFMTSRVQLITQCHMVLEYKPAIRTLFIQLQVHRTFPTCTSFFDQQHRGSCQHALLIIGIWTYTQVKDKFTGSDGYQDFVSNIPINLRVHCSFLTAR